MACRIGIDTGGTFTDIVLVDEASGEIATVKIASTPGDPARAVLDGLAQLGRPPASIEFDRARHYHHHQRGAAAARRACALPRHRWLRGRASAAARRQAQSLRPTMGAAAAACRPS